MKNYEVTFIVDPVLSGGEIKATAQTFVDLLKSEGCKIVHVDEMGLRQLAYPINKRTSGVYYCIEFISPDSQLISKMELALRRDERVIRYLTVSLDKYGVKYNEDKRGGLIGKVKKKSQEKKEDRRGRSRRETSRTAKPSAPPKKEAPPAVEPLASEPSPAPAMKKEALPAAETLAKEEE